MMQRPQPSNENLLRRQSLDAGPSARIVIAAVNEEAIYDYELALDGIIKMLTYEMLKGVIERPLDSQFAQISSKILIVRPTSSDNRGRTVVSFTSPLVAKRTLFTLRGKEAERMKSLFKSLETHPVSQVAIGMLFEELVHDFISKGLGPSKLTRMVGANKVGNTHYEALAHVRDNDVLMTQLQPRDVDLIHSLGDVLIDDKLSTSLYYIQRKGNELAFDSFLVDIIDGEIIITFFFRFPFHLNIQ